MSTVSITIDRSDLSLPDLVIADDSTTFRLALGGLGYVTQAARIDRSPTTRGVDGSEVAGYARDETSLTITTHLLGASWSDVEGMVDELEAACFRPRYDVTRTVGGVSKTWEAGPCFPVPANADLSHGYVAQFFDTFAVTFPFFNPNPS